MHFRRPAGTILTMIRLNAQIDSELAKFAGSQLPFVTSLALNRTAAGARDLVRENLPKRFRLKRQSIPKTIKALMSTKANLTAQVMAPSFLRIHETGGTMRPTSSSMLAAKMEGVTTRAFGRREGTFRVDVGNGHDAVFKRAGRGGKGIKLLAWLSDEHQFEERLHMEDDVRAYVQSRFSSHFTAALTQALATARP